MSLRTIAWSAAALLALAMSGYALSYLVLGERMFPGDLVESFRARPWGIYPHALLGAPALAIGPMQFLRGSFSKRPALHRALGRVYVVCGLGTGLSGLYMSFHAQGGAAAGLGFAGMALATLVCTGAGFRAIRRGDVATHRVWMLRSCATIFSAVTFRVWLPILVIALGDFATAYAVAAWTSWVPNLLFAEWLARRAGWIQGGRPALLATG